MFCFTGEYDKLYFSGRGELGGTDLLLWKAYARVDSDGKSDFPLPDRGSPGICMVPKFEATSPRDFNHTRQGFLAGNREPSIAKGAQHLVISSDFLHAFNSN